MEQREYENLHSLRKNTQLLLSVSVFSIFVSYSFFFYSIHFHSIDKKIIFLICNGILVFLAKTSGLIRFSPAFDINHHYLLEKIEDGRHPIEDYGLRSTSETNELFLEKEVSLESTHTPLENVLVGEESKFSTERESSGDSSWIVEDEEKDPSSSGLLKMESGDEENERELDTMNGFLIIEEEEDMLLSTEELNKKFDEFIRRIKEEIRIGAQQLIMVH